MSVPVWIAPMTRRLEDALTQRVPAGYRVTYATDDDEPLIDPDCRDGKCLSCVGGPCEHDCHG